MRALIVAVMLACTPASAQDVFVPQSLPSEDFDGPGILLARAEQVIPLVRSTRDIRVADYPDQAWPSDLRVSLVVLHNGPSTDVSPVHDLHLAMFNLIPEYGTAWALEPVASVYRFEGVTRTAPGIYEVTALRYDFQQRGCDGFVRSVITVDARDLSVAVRQARGLGEFDARRYTVPIRRTVIDLPCNQP